MWWRHENVNSFTMSMNFSNFDFSKRFFPQTSVQYVKYAKTFLNNYWVYNNLLHCIYLFGPAGGQRAAGTDARDPSADPDGYVQARLDSRTEGHPSTVWGHCCQEHCWGWGLVQVKGQTSPLNSSSLKISSLDSSNVWAAGPSVSLGVRPEPGCK